MTIDARLALTKTILDVFVMSDPYEQGEALDEALYSLITDLDAHELGVFPLAFGSALTALESDLLRWRAAGDLVVRLDLFEMAPAMIDGLGRQRDLHQTANLATLSTNPAVPMAVRREVQRLVNSVSATQDLWGLLQVRIGEKEPSTSWERRLDAQVWPGRHNLSTLRAAAPLVYVSVDEAPVESVWHSVAALARAGARLRRVAAHEPRATPWATPLAPLVHWSGNAVATWRALTGSQEALPLVLGPERVDSPLEAARLVNRVQSAMPAGIRMRRQARAPEHLPQAFAPEVLDAGAYDAAEMTYLGAASRNMLQRFTQEGLVLSGSAGDVNRWRFSQLVAVRLVAGLRMTGVRPRLSPARLVGQLGDIASANAKHRVGIGADGNIYVDDGDGFRNIRSDQQTIEPVLAIDDAFRPFELGGGRVPDLLRPGRSTTVHPLTLGGTPCVEDRRISARVLAIASHRGHTDDRVLRSAYPELTAAELSDAVAVGDGILASSR